MRRQIHKLQFILLFVTLLGIPLGSSIVSDGKVLADTTCGSASQCQIHCNDGYTETYDPTRSSKTGAAICDNHQGVKSDGASTAGAPAAGQDLSQIKTDTVPNCDPNSKTPGAACDNTDSCPNEKCIINKYLNPLIALLSAMAGLLVVIGIIVGGIQYSTSAGDPQKAAAGRGKIIKSLIGLVSYLFLYAFLQFIVPGGIG